MAPSLITLLFLFSLRVLAVPLSPDSSGASKVGNGQHQSSIGSQCLSSLDCGANGNIACCAFLPQTGGATIGICSGCGATTQAGKQSCGFGDADKANLASDPQVCPASSFANGVIPGSGGAAASNGNAAASSAVAAAPAVSTPAAAAPAASPAAGGGGGATLPDPGLDAGKGNQANKQFITGACINSKDCGASQSDLANVCCASVMNGGQTVGVCSGSAVGNAAPKLGCGFGDGKANAAA